MKYIVNISPPKCGTTGLFHVLGSSPEISQPTIKEPRFFCDEAPGVSAGVPDALVQRGNFARGQEWFNSLYASDDASYRLDFTTLYALTVETPKLLSSVCQMPKLIFVLRDPVARFISHYHQYGKTGIELPPLEDVVRGEDEISAMLYGFADYRATYERFAKEFGSAAVLALSLGELREDDEALRLVLAAFLEIEVPHYAPSMEARNVAGVPRFKLVQPLLFGETSRRIQRRVPSGAKVAALKLRKRILRATTVAQPYAEPSESVVRLLTERLEPQAAFMDELLARRRDEPL